MHLASIYRIRDMHVDSYIQTMNACQNFFYRYLAEKTIQRGDDFMGRLFHPLRSIPTTGEEKTFVLYSHSGKTQHGYVALQLNIGAKQKKIPLEVPS